TTQHMIEGFLIDILRDNEIEHPDEVTLLFSRVRGNNMAKAAIEGAIWDLYAKQKKIPLAKALGGKKSEIELVISIVHQSTIQERIPTIHTHIEQCFNRIKL